MNTLFQAMNKTASTDNGALAHHNSLSANLDFFYLAGASRGKDLKQEFIKALNEDRDVALRTLQWLRDIRGGAGERQLFRELLKVAFENSTDHSPLCQIVDRIPEIGRYDDLLWLIENIMQNKPNVATYCEVIFANGLRQASGLAFKWTPIKGATAKKLRTMMGFKKEADWRKFVVAGRKTVEQQMCAKEWSEINFSHVPSVASARYQKAFGRNASKEYGEYLASLQKGEAGVKINASAVYPIDVFKSCYNGSPEVAEQQWKALPNYLEGNSERILPLIDVSGSMGVSAGGSSVSCMDVAISLGWYIADKIEGKFKNTFMTFEDVPRMLQLTNLSTLKDTFDTIRSVSWGGSTNIQNAFKVLLTAAVQNEVPKEDMPTTIMIFSDMQFDCSYVGGRSVTAFDMVKAEYIAAGYEIPKIVFWNLNASNKTIPVTKDETGTAMVSGYSPSLLKGILKGGMTPEQIMLDTIMIDRYKL